MITLEFSPEALAENRPPHLSMNTTPSEPVTWEETRITDEQTGETLGWARQKPNPSHQVRFFYGKGGFCAIISGDDLIYFALPGSHLKLPDTEVNLIGDFITGKSSPLSTVQTPAPLQTASRQAMILGAGMATRFEPVSGDTTGLPKPGVPLVGEDSVITNIARLLKAHGFTRILVNTFYKPQALKSQLAQVAGIEVGFIDEDAPSGTAGGLTKALEQGLVDESQPILIIQGDAITDADLSFLLNTHQAQGAAVTIGGQIVSDQDVDKFGIIETDASAQDGHSGNITSFKEKPSLVEAGSSRFANSGFYILAPEVFPLFRELGKTLLSSGQVYDYAQDFFPAVLKATASGCIQNSITKSPLHFWAQAIGGYWSDMGNPQQYLQSIRDIYAGRLQIPLPENPEPYYSQQIPYWPGTLEKAKADGAELSGNIIVGCHYQEA